MPIGLPIPRVDGPLKVSGEALYTADHLIADRAYGVIVGSSISKGRVVRIDESGARHVPGVMEVITHSNMPPLASPDPRPDALAQARLPLQDSLVTYFGEPVALVMAATTQAAFQASEALKIEYEAASDARLSVQLEKSELLPSDDHNVAWTASGQPGEVTFEGKYSTPFQHHCAMELPATTAVWDAGQLTVYEGTQWLAGVVDVLSKCFNHPAGRIRVICPFLGGSFGSKRLTWPHVLLAVAASKLIGKPISVMLSRRQSFSMVGHRPLTEQSVRLRAARDGSLADFQHVATTTTSMNDDFIEPATSKTRMIYACPSGNTSRRQVKLNGPTPTTMRAPGEATGFFALESAMDELAYLLDIDPLQLRRTNYASKDPMTSREWSSKALRECYDVGSSAFGWKDRPMSPRSLRDGNRLIGWGMASAAYPVNRSPASARVQIDGEGRVTAVSATHEMGAGTYTAMTQIVANVLGVAINGVTVSLGDSALPKTTVSGGSRTLASVGSALFQAAGLLRAKLIDLAVSNDQSPLRGSNPDQIVARDGFLVQLSDPTVREAMSTVVRRSGASEIGADASSVPLKDDPLTRLSFGAHFVEVAVDQDLGFIRVTRVVSCFGAGRILNPMIARSQIVGGIVQGIGSALLEGNSVNPVNGSFAKSSLAEYLVPVNADIPPIEVHFVDEFDVGANPLGTKGVGELGIVGTAAAVTNAIFHATGIRIRRLPARIDDLIGKS